MCGSTIYRYVLFIFLCLPTLVAAADLHVTINNVTSLKGRVVVAVFPLAAASDFPKEGSHSMGAKVKPTSSAVVSAVFNNVAVGEYAIAIYHDENNNGKLDTNFLGVPKEPFGFSNNARALLGPPKFSAAAFIVDNSEPQIITIDF